jgi:hypothetical protein
MFKFERTLAAIAMVSLGLIGCQFVLTPPSSETLGDNIYRVSWGPGPAVGNNANSWNLVALLAERKCPNGYNELQRTVDRSDGLVLRMTVKCL